MILDSSAFVFILAALGAHLYLRWIITTQNKAHLFDIKTALEEVRKDCSNLRKSIHDIRGKLGALSGMQYLKQFEKDNENKDNIN